MSRAPREISSAQSRRLPRPKHVQKLIRPGELRDILEGIIVWPPDLKTMEVYTRTQDGHDGDWKGKLSVNFTADGDAWVMTDTQEFIRFRTIGGGGNSVRTRNALLMLAEAIRLDSLDRPDPEGRIKPLPSL